MVKEDFRSSEYKLFSMWILFIYRIGNKVYYSNFIFKNPILFSLNIIRKVFVDLLFQVDIPFRVQIGKGIRLKHPRGIVIHPRAIIGSNCTIYHQVTIGVNEHAVNKNVATIGDNVYMGAGSKVIGEVKIGDHSNIGANAVVHKDVPAYSTIVMQSMMIINNSKIKVT